MCNTTANNVTSKSDNNNNNNNNNDTIPTRTMKTATYMRSSLHNQLQTQPTDRQFAWNHQRGATDSFQHLSQATSMSSFFETSEVSGYGNYFAQQRRNEAMAAQRRNQNEIP